jgi:hypothetical protein
MIPGTLEKEAIRILQVLTEAELRDCVVKLYFERKGWKVERVDAESNLHSACDLLISRALPGTEEVVGIQIRIKIDIDTRQHAEAAMLPSALRALDYRWQGLGYLARYYWITTGSITDKGHVETQALIDGDITTRGRVSVWDATTLFSNLFASDLLAAIEPLQSIVTARSFPVDQIAPSPTRRCTIFVSYSKEDEKCLEEIKAMLGWSAGTGALDLWDFSQTPTGALWASAIEQELAAARVAILLVSPDFLNSPYIRRTELPFLLEAASRNQVRLVWVLVRPCNWEDTEIAPYWASHDVGEPLSVLRRPQRELKLKRICRQIKDVAKETISLLQVNYAVLQQHRGPGGIFAAHWSYRVFRRLLHFADLAGVLKELKNGLISLAEDSPARQNSYYARTYQRVFTLWNLLLTQRPDLVMPMDRRIELTLGRPEIGEFLAANSSLGISSVTLLQDFELCFRQLVKLEERYVDAPTGLSTLMICRLLLRFAFSPTEPRIEARFKRMSEDLKKEFEYSGASIDDQCSLCTGVLLSCFSLARRQGEVGNVRDWLLSLSEYRFCHIVPRSNAWKAGDNSLEYASQVLLGLLDFDSKQRESLEPVLNVFFEFIEKGRDSRGFYREWLLHSDISRFEVYRPILSSFLRYFLAGEELPSARKKRLRVAIAALVRELNEESPDKAQAFRFGPSRDNLPALALGAWLGVPKAADLLLKVVRLHHKLALHAGERRDDQLWDSNVDRTATFVEGLLEYWETHCCPRTPRTMAQSEANSLKTRDRTGKV